MSHHPTEARRLEGVVWCCTQATHKTTSALTCGWNWSGRPGYEDFVRCTFESKSYEDTLEHVLETGHWVNAYPNGDRNKQPLADIHDSTVGGAYVNVYALDAK